MGNGENTLLKNAIKQFILRVDLLRKDGLKMADIAEGMSKHFDRSEKRQIIGLQLTLTQGKMSNLHPQDIFDFVLISEANSTTLTLSEIQNAFWIECTNYMDNSVYKDIIRKIVEVTKGIFPDTQSKRIGLRYVNEFRCDNPKAIGKIYCRRLAAITKQMINRPKFSRAIGVEESNSDGYRVRLQYGIPNKFYPSVATVFDLLLDIDSFIEGANSIYEWEETIVNLNHAAYGEFITQMNPNYLKELK